MPEHTEQDSMALRLATSADVAVDPRWLADVDSVAELLKRDSLAYFIIYDTRDGFRRALHAGPVDADAVLGLCHRILPGMAEAE